MPTTFHLFRCWAGRLLTIGVLGAAGIAALSGSVSAGTLKTLHNFCAKPNCTDGNTSVAAMLMVGTDKLYGTASAGGANGGGEVFQLSQATDGSWKFKVIYSFCAKANCTDGKEPLAGLIVDQSGNLYGTTWTGGAHMQGAVFQLKPGTPVWKETVVYNFCPLSGCGDGRNPASGLTYAGQATGAPWDEFSPLFGTTTGGGRYDHGVVYRLTSDGSLWNYTNLYTSQTASYFGELAIDGTGNLFGAARDGGQNGGGLFFKLAHDTFKGTTLYQFCQDTNCTDGAHSTARPVIGANGTLFSTTTSGGNAGGGVVFQLAPVGAAYSYGVIYDACSTGLCITGQPPSALTMDGNGDLFGTGVMGTNSPGGAVFQLRHSSFGWIGTRLYLFCLKTGCKDGAWPKAGVVLDAAGHLFGTTTLAGYYNGGNIFEVTP